MCSCCFPSSAKLWTQTGSHLIPDLRPSDQLLTLKPSKAGTKPGLKKDNFLTYLHFDTKVRAEFLQLKAENGAELTITGTHLLFTKTKDGSLSPVPANSLNVGDTLVYLGPNMEAEYPKVVQIRSVAKEGIYAPLTKSGTMIVDGFLVSCYADVESHRKAHLCLALARLWYGVKLRAQKTNKRGCEKSNGILGYAKVLLRIQSILPGLKI